MELDQHIAALERDGRLLADAAERSGLAAPVPSCAPWRIRDAGAVLSGPAQGLYLLLWNRQDIEAAGATVSGDTDVLPLWRDSMQVRWT